MSTSPAMDQFLPPLHLSCLESDWAWMQRTGGHPHEYTDRVAARQAGLDTVLALLSSRGGAAPLSDPLLSDPLVYVTAERALPTSVFFPHALEGSAQDFSAADLRAWASVCSAWAGWVRRLLRRADALRWLWCRLVLSNLEQVSSGFVRHPEIRPRACFRALLLEQRERDAFALSLEHRTPTAAEANRVYASDIVGGMSDTWAYFANFHDDAECRVHGYGYGAELEFRPYLSRQGAYHHLAEDESEDETAAMANLLVGMFEAVNNYLGWVVEEHEIEENLTLSTILRPGLETALSQVLRFLQIDLHECNEQALRAAMTPAKAAELRAALSDYACLFPLKADIDRAVSGVAVHAGRFESVLEPDREDGEEGEEGVGEEGVGEEGPGLFRFKVVRPMGMGALMASLRG